MALIYTNTRSPKRKPGIKQLRSKEEHLAYLKSLGYTPGMRIERTTELPKYEYRRVTSDRIPGGGGYKKSVEDYKWKKDQEESAATIKEIERKKTCLAPLYSKGPVQFITEKSDPKTIGKKV
jgi:hypothetical protein